MPNTETVKDTKEGLFQAWEEILNIAPDLGRDLILYAFYTSGFSKSVGDFSEHIPNSWLKVNKFHEDIKRKNGEFEDPSALTEKEDFIYKNLYRNNQLVPVVNDKSSKVMMHTDGDKGIVNKAHGFLIPANDTSNYIIGVGPNGPVFKRYVKRQVVTEYDIDNITPLSYDYYLYKLAGYTHTGEPIYLRTNKLGMSGYGNNIKEYFGDGKTSIFPQNNVSLPEALQTLSDEVESRGNIIAEEYKKIKNPEFGESKPEDRLLFCIVKA